MADKKMIEFGIGVFILGIIGLTLQWNPIIEFLSENTEFIDENLEVIQQSSIIAIIGGLFFMVFGGRR